MPHDFALTLEHAVTPLRPVTTRWLSPTAAEEGSFARPFVPGAARQGSWIAAGDQAAPAETLPAGEAAPAEDLLMAWEEAPAPRYQESHGVGAEVGDDQPATAVADTWADSFTVDSGRAVVPWEEEQPGAEEAGSPDRPFPLDAFLIPENATRLPAGLENDRELQDRIAADVADALSAMVDRLRSDGLDALLSPSARREPVDVVLAAVLSGYLSRRAP
jgi:hypothetical protein